MTWTRPLLLIASYWKMDVTKYYIYHHVLYMAVSFSMPLDYGKFQVRFLVWQAYAVFILLSFKFWKTISSIIALQLYVGIVVRHYVFGDDIESKLLI